MDAFFYSTPLPEVTIPWWAVGVFAVGLLMTFPYSEGSGNIPLRVLMVAGCVLAFVAVVFVIFSMMFIPLVRSTVGPGINTAKVVSEHYGAHDIREAVCPAGSYTNECFTYTADDGSQEFVRVTGSWEGQKAGYNITVEHLGNRPPAPTPTPSSKETSS